MFNKSLASLCRAPESFDDNPDTSPGDLSDYDANDINTLFNNVVIT